MAVTLESPKYSFVQFRTAWEDKVTYLEDNQEGNELGVYLPCQSGPGLSTELQFQFSLYADSPSEADTLMTMSASNFRLYVINGAGALVPPANLPLSVDQTGWIFKNNGAGLGVQRFRISPYQVLVYIPLFPNSPATGGDIWANHVEECFQLVFTIQSSGLGPPFPPPAPTIKVISNPFKFIKDLNYTTFLQYKGDQDEAGFLYCPELTIFNSVRVPMYLRAHVYTEDVIQYRLSDGKLKTTKEIVTKQYNVKTEYLPEWMHDCLRASLIHDNIYVKGLKFTGLVKKTAPYEIEWEDNDFPLGTAKFRFDAMTLIKNNNCSVCFDPALPPAPPIIITDPITSGPVSPGIPGFLELAPFVETEVLDDDLFFYFDIIAPQGIIESAEIINDPTLGYQMSFTVASDAESVIDLPAFIIWASSAESQSNYATILITIEQ